MTTERLAEALGALSYATDHASGQPQGTTLGATVLSVRLGRRLGLSETELADLYHASVLRRIGCTSTASEVAPLALGDERAANLALNLADLTRPDTIRRSLEEWMPAAAPDARGAAIAGIAAIGPGLAEVADAHCVQAVTLTRRLPLPTGVAGLLAQVDARWDGLNPLRASGAAIPRGTRVMEFAAITHLHQRAVGIASALGVASSRAGSQFDPGLAAIFGAEHDALTEGLDGPGIWDAFMASEPGTPVAIRPDDLRTVAFAFADFSDQKSRYFLGHSRRVAALAFAAAVDEELDRELCQAVFDAGLLHDIGRCAVPTGIWEKPSALNRQERLEAESHSFHTARILGGSPVFDAIAGLASSVHERSDGSGYHRGIRLSNPAAALLAAANFYDEITQATAERPALTRKTAEARMQDEAKAGRLPADSVSAVLRAAGHRAKADVPPPAGLTRREIDVLVWIAKGESGKAIAARLGITPKTVEKHSENIFRKVGVRSRTAAALFAMEQGLVDR